MLKINRRQTDNGTGSTVRWIRSYYVETKESNCLLSTVAAKNEQDTHTHTHTQHTKQRHNRKKKTSPHNTTKQEMNMKK